MVGDCTIREYLCHYYYFYIHYVQKVCTTLSCQFVVAIIYEVSGLSDSEHTCGCVSLEDTDGSVSSLVVGSTSSLSGICRESP